MAQSIFLRFAAPIAISVVLVCATIPASANHGGGGGHGGGGSHGGGGGGSHGGGGTSRGAASAPRASGAGSYGSNARPSANSYRSSASPSAGSQRAAGVSAAPRANADGQWHSFAGGTGNGGAASTQTEARASGSAGGGWQVFGGSRSVSAGSRSFVGQGHDVWETTPQSRNAVPASRALSNIRGPFGNSAAGNTALRSNALLSANSGLTRSGLGSTSALIRSNPRFGFPYGRFGGGMLELRFWIRLGFGFRLARAWFLGFGPVLE